MTPPHRHTPPRTAGAPAEVERSPGVAAEQVLEPVVEPVVEAMGYELVLLEWAASGRHRRLRVYIDHPDGVSLDDCAQLSPIVGNALDAAEADPETPEVAAVLHAPYVLEVSSPGLDRPLRRRGHFERFAGKRATVRCAVPIEAGSNQRTFHGRIEGIEPDAEHPDDQNRGTVSLLDDEGHLHRIPLTRVRRANLVYEG